MRAVLLKYIPENAVNLYLKWQNQHPHQLLISRPRKTKLGDYRPPYGKRQYHKISVNANLNQYEFLLTLTHEVAHLFTHIKYGKLAAPHGVEWKQIYKKLLEDAITANCFPQSVLPVLKKHCSQPKASSCVDVDLYKALRQFSKQKNKLPLVEDIETGKKFMLKGGKRFVKGILMRKRYQCEEIGTGKIYAVSPIAEVLLTE